MSKRIDLDMLSSDIADMLDRYDYDLDVSAADVRPALPAFLAQITARDLPDPALAAERARDALNRLGDADAAL